MKKKKTRSRACSARAPRARTSLSSASERREDTVIGEAGNAAARAYAQQHGGPAACLELARAGHVSFTSCEHYTATYGNGIGPSKSLTRPGEIYEPLPIEQQHAVINQYGLAFLDKYLKPEGHPLHAQASTSQDYLTANHFDASEVSWQTFEAGAPR